MEQKFISVRIAEKSLQSLKKQVCLFSAAASL